MVKKIKKMYDFFFEKCAQFDFIVLLATRLYLLPTFFEGAKAKILGFSATIAWFAAPTSQGGLHLPFPQLMAFLATGAEVAALVCIAIGLFTRIVAIPMMVVMSVATFTVHWSHGWWAIASRTMESSARLSHFMAWLATYFPGRYNYITALGDPVILNNGIEFTTTYLIMLLVLFFYGGGRYVSADYWIAKYFFSDRA